MYRFTERPQAWTISKENAVKETFKSDLFTIVKLEYLRHNHFEKLYFIGFKADAATICLLLLLPLCENFVSVSLTCCVSFLYNTILQCYVCRRWPGRTPTVAITRLFNVRPSLMNFVVLFVCFFFLFWLWAFILKVLQTDYLNVVSCRSGGIRTGFMEAKLHQNKTNTRASYLQNVHEAKIWTSSTVLIYFCFAFNPLYSF